MRPGGRRRRETELDISLAPFIDVIFLLLCFFVVTTRFDDFNFQPIELPETSAERRLVEQEFIEIAILSSGRVLIGKDEFSDAEDAGIATTLYLLDKDRPVLIKADTNSRHGDVVRIMDTATIAGFGSISIASVEKKEDRGSF